MVASGKISNKCDCLLCKRRGKSEVRGARRLEGQVLWGMKSDGNHKDFLGTGKSFLWLESVGLTSVKKSFSSPSNLQLKLTAFMNNLGECFVFCFTLIFRISKRLCFTSRPKDRWQERSGIRRQMWPQQQYAGILGRAILKYFAWIWRQGGSHNNQIKVAFTKYYFRSIVNCNFLFSWYIWAS